LELDDVLVCFHTLLAELIKASLARISIFHYIFALLTGGSLLDVRQIHLAFLTLFICIHNRISIHGLTNESLTKRSELANKPPDAVWSHICDGLVAAIERVQELSSFLISDLLLLLSIFLNGQILAKLNQTLLGFKAHQGSKGFEVFWGQSVREFCDIVVDEFYFCIGGILHLGIHHHLLQFQSRNGTVLVRIIMEEQATPVFFHNRVGYLMQQILF
jgi:hypothetical protein